MPLSGSSIIHPDLADRLAGWRRRGLPDTCTITRPSTAAATIDPTTKTATPAAPTLVYSGASMLQPARTPADKVVLAGDTTTQVDDYVASIDAAETDVLPGDVYTHTSSGDPALVGKTLVVTTVLADSVPSRRLLGLAEQARAEGGAP